ncbi:hypothetical protein BJ166DRAFT_520528 [Pestalotiopsis sp. NC0098]|nr:hypothetical protein BJ166DRAFT_520528 [Pestalotiopsis sp. NC0098]
MFGWASASDALLLLSMACKRVQRVHCSALINMLSFPSAFPLQAKPSRCWHGPCLPHFHYQRAPCALTISISAWLNKIVMLHSRLCHRLYPNERPRRVGADDKGQSPFIRD